MSKIEAKLTDPKNNVFCDVILRCTGEFHEYFDHWATELRERLHVAIFAQAEKEFHENCPTEVQPVSPEEQSARGSVLEVVKEARGELVKLQNDVAELKARCDSNTESL